MVEPVTVLTEDFRSRMRVDQWFIVLCPRPVARATAMVLLVETHPADES